ncbi:MAG: nucleotidyltransferase domain-containing protein [Candidatus Chromulinivorax sp.]|nr:nucleotidyltransferase domain-containing protein [Candidatus Chromulinivorax sp.]
MHKIPQEKQEQIIKVIEIFFPNAKIYLFGSRAKNTHTVISDVDIAVDAGQPMDIVKESQINSMIDALNIPQNVDLVDFQSAPEALRANILRDGIVWKD